MMQDEECVEGMPLVLVVWMLKVCRRCLWCGCLRCDVGACGVDA